MVEWKKLGDVCDFQNGFAFKSGLFKSEGVPIIRITNITSNNIDMTDCKFFAFDDYTKFNLNPFVVESGDILLAMSGATTGKIGVYRENEKAYLNQRVGKFVPHKTELDNRYLYHFLLSKTSTIYIMAGGGAQPNLSSNKLMEELRLPIPSINQQENIAKILDTFTSSIDNLKQQIAQRRKQYEYYRDQLLDLEGKEGVEMKTIGDLFVFKNGLNKEKKYFGEGTPIVNYTDVYHNKRLDSSILNGRVTLSESEIDRFRVHKGDVFFTRTSETPEEVGYAAVMLEEVENCTFSGFLLRARPITNLLLPEFCAYCFGSYKVRQSIIKYSTFTTRALTNGPSLSKISVPVPSLSEQQRIVDILDKFEASIQNLEAQLSQREKQYEYYRNKLLTFE